MSRFRFYQLLEKIDQTINNGVIFPSVREGLLNIAPILLIGAIALLLHTLPIDMYQDFIGSFAGGFLYQMFHWIYQITFGLLSLFLTVSIAIRFCGKTNYKSVNYIGTIFSAVCVFFVMTEAMLPENIVSLGVNGVFTAIVSGLLGPSLFITACKRKRKFLLKESFGIDASFSNAFRMIEPLVETCLLVVIFNKLLELLTGFSCFQNMYLYALKQLFDAMGRNVFSGFFYIIMVHILWLFGIHGSNIFQSVFDNTFQPAVEENMAVLKMGGVPDQIYCKGFFDISSLLGGSGTTLCLIIAILLFSKRKYHRQLATLSILPGMFNINEPLLFGIPIVLNPILAIPFLLTPVFCFITSSLAMYFGWVPVVVRNVEWTTPIFLSGFMATGSVQGVLLQIFNLFCGILIYKPFVELMDNSQYRDKDKKMHRLVEILKESEISRVPVRLMQRTDEVGSLAKCLGEELDVMIDLGEPAIFYQPQFNEKGKCIGAEGLYRWDHDYYGLIYPPVVFQLAQEMGRLIALEEKIFQKVVFDCDELLRILGQDAKISVNVTGYTVQTEEYVQLLEKTAKAYPEYTKHIMIEITEQANIKLGEEFTRKLNRIKALGYRLAIDDFSMGNTSIQYLQTNAFSMIKLDGALTRDIITNTTSQGITESLAKLSQEFGLMILAEFVEEEDQRKILEKLGCNLYQGALYSRAISVKELEEFINKTNMSGD